MKLGTYDGTWFIECRVTTFVTLPHEWCQNQWRKGMLRIVQFPNTYIGTHSYGSWDKSKNPYPLKIHIIPKAAMSGASWFLGHDRCPIWNYLISQWAWVLCIRSSGPGLTWLSSVDGVECSERWPVNDGGCSGKAQALWPIYSYGYQAEHWHEGECIGRCYYLSSWLLYRWW